ncbi:hypothetical protein [Yinghuangia seranimata]|uniref:hypothetical protein n=1 Tax=Yinghuangia seranimata TaxID=408067 RepID=UPI00248C5B63|nr:hypothetical protein [Yinghuangia seranimata]MDI2126274.1 hypothetical protein [Yinghuangia seranimata]
MGVGVHLVWPSLLATWLTYSVGRYGFAPMDQGFTQALSWRILHGQVPHADFFSPRPAGSAVFHLVDFVLPGPLMLVQAWVACLEFVGSAVALAVLATGRGVVRFGPLLVGCVAAAAMVDLHMWPAMTWHTTDGIFFASVGWALVDRGRRRTAVRRSGLVVAGCAVVCKQSFAPVPLVAAALLLSGPDRRARVRELPLLAGVPVAYVVWVVLGGGAAELPDQLLGADGVWGERLLTMLPDMLRGTPQEARWAVLYGLALVGWVLARRLPTVPRWADLGARAVASVAVVGELAQASMSFDRVLYSCLLWWMLLAAAVADALVRRRPPVRALPVLALGWMAALSYGYDVPALVGGSLALTLLVVLWRDVPPPIRPGGLRRTGVLVVAGALVASAGAVKLIHVRDTYGYLDGGRPGLTHGMGAVSSDLRGIRTTEGDLRYMAQIRDCVAARPASRVAVLPDAAAAYPLFRLDNPFPMDWLYVKEVTNPEARKLMVKRAKELDREGDYLVLFSTLDVRFLAKPGYVPDLVRPDQPIRHWSRIEVLVRRELHGEVFGCGSFVAVWAPGR